MHKLCVFIIVLGLFLEFCDGQSVRVNCPHIRHNVLSSHRLHRCIRNLQGMMTLLCNISQRRHRHGVQIQRNSLTEEQSQELYCQCCSNRCSRRTLLSYCH